MQAHALVNGDFLQAMGARSWHGSGMFHSPHIHLCCNFLYHLLQPAWCRRDNGPMCKSPISTSFGPQNITVIMSQESHYWNAFLIRFTKTHFLHLPNYGYWDVSYIVGKVWMRRLQRHWNCRKQFSIGGEILETSLANVDFV